MQKHDNNILYALLTDKMDTEPMSPPRDNPCAVAVKEEDTHDISSDEWNDDVEIYCVRVPPMPPLVEAQGNVQINPVFERRLTNAEKCKKYRKRKKDASLKIKKKSLTPAERSRMYRLRKKQLTQGIKSSVNEVLYTPSTSNSRMTFEPSPQPVSTATFHYPDEKKPIDISRNFIQKKLIVYTKRLDDMKIFTRTYHNNYPKTFLSGIQDESKPQLSADSYKRRAVYGANYRRNLKAFGIVKSRITGYNKFIRDRRVTKILEQYVGKQNMIPPVAQKPLGKNFTRNKVKKLPKNSPFEPTPVPSTLNLVQKALLLNPLNKATPKSKKFPRETQIILNYGIDNEYCRIGLDGQIVRHLKNVSQMFIEKQRQLFYGNTIYENVCCWFVRKKLIKSLRKTDILADIWKYMETRHTCINNCKCCCKPKPVDITNMKLNELSLPDIPHHTTDICNKITPLKFMFVRHEPIVPCASISTKDSIVDEQPVKKADDARSEMILIKNIENANNDKPSEVDSFTTERENHYICVKTELLLEKQLKRLKNISVYITPQAKITATLSVPVSTLTTDELKFLSAILNQAQKDIDRLFKQGHYGCVSNDPETTDPTATTSEISKTKPHNTALIKRPVRCQKTTLYDTFARLCCSQNETFSRCISSLWKAELKKTISMEKAINQEPKNRETKVLEKPTQKSNRKPKFVLPPLERVRVRRPYQKWKKGNQLAKKIPEPEMFSMQFLKEVEITERQSTSQSLDDFSIDPEVTADTQMSTIKAENPLSPISSNGEQSCNFKDEILDISDAEIIVKEEDEDFILGV